MLIKIIRTSIIVKAYKKIIYQLGVFRFVCIYDKNKIIIFLLIIFIVTYTLSNLLHFFNDKRKKIQHIFISCLLHNILCVVTKKKYF